MSLVCTRILFARQHVLQLPFLSNESVGSDRAIELDSTRKIERQWEIDRRAMKAFTMDKSGNFIFAIIQLKLFYRSKKKQQKVSWRRFFCTDDSFVCHLVARGI
jgi:hypothetical protein